MSTGKPIVVQVSGGLVQAVMNVPEGVVVQVVDFDVEGVDDDLLSKWEGIDGTVEECVITEYSWVEE